METIGVIYGVRLASSEEYRYVGLTTKTVIRRFQQHLRNAERGHKNPFYDWLRKRPTEEIVVDTLETVTSNLEDLGQAEISWISALNERGDRLLNLTEGGLGPMGYVWTAEQRAAAAKRATGRKIPPRPGAANPFFGKTHTPEQRATWSKSRAGSITGAKNPNYGKFGKDHPSYGHVMSLESRKRLSEQKGGPLNPNYGKVYTAEERAAMSARSKGKPMPSSVRSAHTRHHTNKGVHNPACAHCIEDALKVVDPPIRKTSE